MTDETGHEPRMERGGGRLRRIVSAVWLVPIVAILIAGAVAYQSLRDRGTLIAIAFPDVAGITIGQTALRYRDVVVGVVEDVGFTADLTLVNVFVRVNKEIAPYLDDDASFWIVQPEVSARGVSGLTTILSGVYIEGTWDAEPEGARTAFLGNERAPVIPPSVEGTAIVLRARESGRLEAGAPILFKGIEVGETSSPRLSRDGTEVRMDAFIRAPYDRQLTTATRFWDVSGVSATLGGSGVELRVQSLAAILEGGLNFDTLISGGQPIEQGHVFDVYADEDSARTSAFQLPNSRSVPISALFPVAAAGLSDGAAVRYNGVRVGVVTGVTGFIRPDDETRSVQLLARMAVQPGRMGLDTAFDDVEAVDFIDGLARAGLRARLVSTSLFGGELAVELFDGPEGVGPGLEVGVADTPLIPSEASEESSFQDTAEGVLARVNDLPIEELLASFTDLADNLNRIVADPDTRALPADLRETVAQAQGLVRDGRSIVASPDTAATLLSIREATGDIRTIVAGLAEREVAAQVDEVLTAATTAAENIAQGTGDLPAIAATARSALEAADGLLASEDLAAAPALVRGVLEDGRAVLSAPEVETILRDTAAATAALRAVSEAVADVEVGARLDTALTSIDAAAANVAAGTADLQTLRVALDRAVGAAADILDDPATRALPASARTALDGIARVTAAPQIESILTDAQAAAGAFAAVATRLEEAGLAERIDAALASTGRAADSIAAGTADLPELSASVRRAVEAAETILANPDTQAIPGAARGALEGIDAVVSDPDVDALIADLAATAAQTREIATSLAAADAGARLAETLEAANAAATAVAEGVERLPALAEQADRVLTEGTVLLKQLQAVADKANALELEGLVASATRFLDSADAFISSDGADDVPPALVDTLEEIRLLVNAIRTEGTLDNVNTTLASASSAARSIDIAAQQLPDLLSRLAALSNSAGTLLTTYSDGSRFSSDLIGTLDAVASAAEEIEKLARTLERNPNALIFGR